jgi:uncharacterized LabA/DUF88 family protein
MPHQKLVIVVDNSNLFIEGAKYSAQKKGVFPKPGEKFAPQDPTWRVDFGKLITVIANGREIYEAILVGSRPPANDSVWNAAEASGFKVMVHDRNIKNKEKAVDTELVAQATRSICKAPEKMDLAIVSGDRDFIPLVNVAQEEGWEVEMWAWTNAFTEHGNMAQSVNHVNYLDDFFYKIGGCVNNLWP